MQRKEFVKLTCGVCIGVAAGLIPGSFLTSCTTTSAAFKTEIKNNTITVPAAQFAATSLVMINPAHYDYNIALRKEANGTYTALLMRCTHADNELTSTGNGFVCSLHGSTFDKEGAVTKGPAESSLKRFPAVLKNGEIIITLK